MYIMWRRGFRVLIKRTINTRTANGGRTTPSSRRGKSRKVLNNNNNNKEKILKTRRVRVRVQIKQFWFFFFFCNYARREKSATQSRQKTGWVQAR